MTGKALSAEEAARLLALPVKSRGPTTGTTRQIPGTNRTVRVDLDDRSWQMWWKLPTTATECTVPDHDESESDRARMCVEIDEVMVCRYCYLDSRDSTS